MIPPAWRALLCLLLSALLWTAPGFAQQAPEDPDATLAAARETVDRLEQRLKDERLDSAELPEIRRRLSELQQRAQAIATAQEPLLESAKGRLDELGAAPAEGEAPTVTEQRQTLQATVSQVDARLKLARLLALTSEQLADEAGAKARERYAAELFEPTDSVLSSRFRRSLAASLPRDAARLNRAGQQLRAIVERRQPGAWLAAFGAIALAVVIRQGLRRLIERLVNERTPPGRLRRSLLAFASTLLALLVPGVSAVALLAGLRQHASPAWTGLFDGAIGMALFCAFVGGLGHALLAAGRPSWRLPPLSDALAARWRRMPVLLAWILFFGWLLQRLADVVPLSLPSVVALQAFVAVALALALARLASLHRRAAAESPREPERSWWLATGSGLLRLLLWAVVVAVLAGYVALGRVVVGQAVWTLVLLCAGYLLFALVDDAASAWAAAAPAAAAAEPAPGAAPTGSARAQAAVLASGLLKLLLMLMLLVLLLAPFGEGPGELIGRGERLREGISIGELQLRPAALALALLVGLLMLAAVRLLQRWTAHRLLPTTRLDVGLQSSLVTLIGFVGGVIAVAMALSAMGLALNQVAWIASAMTVGIGFGLQAVVSNFVAGLILLAERPVKVGDWVALGGLEGDIRRINVRTTEIQMPDRSTVIVPNSEFITKVVRNVTHDSAAQGLVQIRLPMPQDCDAGHVRATLLQALHEHGEILETPPPTVLLDGIEGDKLVFNAAGFVASPRRVAATRSELLFRVLGALKEKAAASPQP